MQDLNDLYFFAQVVDHGGFAPAGRALREPKSKLSRRVAQLEARLGVRLIERSTRTFRVTEVGAAFHARCRAILDEVQRAEALAAEAQREPRGLVRLSCPTGLVDSLMNVTRELLVRHPRLRLQVVATDRRVALIDERIDVALRVRAKLDTDADLSVRMLAKSWRLLVAAPALAHRVAGADDVSALASLPTLSSTDDAPDVTWDLFGPGGERRSLRHEPRLSCGDLAALRGAAVAGLGVALLPDHICKRALAAGELVQVLPAWRGVEATMHLVFTSRRGLRPAVRAVIDHLAERLRDESLV